jgi:hypothetical protein
VRGRALAVSSVHRAGERARAVEEAAARALGDADLSPGALTQILGTASDVAALSSLAAVPVRCELEGCLGAASLLAAVRWLAGEQPGLALVVAGDPAGSATAAILDSRS